MISFLAAKAPTGNPPPITFPKQMMSALMFNNSCAPPLARRNPVITSSKIRRIPLAVHNWRKPSRKPLFGGMQPMFPATGSTMMAAISFLLASIKAETLSKSLYLASKVSLAVPAVTPGLFGEPKVMAPLPA